MRQHLALENLISPIVSGLGYTWVGLEYFPQGKWSLLRVYIDKPGGLSVDDCALVSRQLNAVLSVESPIRGEFNLEVSSPGLDRLLFTPMQCQEQVGKLVSIRLIAPIGGKRNYQGRLQGIQDDKLCIITNDGEVTLSFADIVEARLVPEW